LTYQVQAQEGYFLVGKIIDNQTLEPIQYAHVLNLKTEKGSITNNKGYFMLHVSKGDFVKISYVGYHSYYYKVNFDKSDTLTFILNQKVFELDNVDVYPWTRQEFRYKFVYDDIKPDSIDLIKSWIIAPPAEISNIGPIGFSIFANFKTSQEKQIIKLNELKHWLIKEEDYRKKIVKITGYEGIELNLFIKYCNFSKRYVSYARDYYLTLNITQKYLEYERLKTKEKP
jgi:hypothetical protein